MTRISFHFGAADRQQAAADWLALAVRQARRVAVLHSARTELQAFDRRLWCLPATGFVPHCFSGDAVGPDTPAVLTDTLASIDFDDCLLNLDTGVPEGFARFSQLVEFVSTDAEDRARGRERYKFYRDRGYAIDNIDLGAPV